MAFWENTPSTNSPVSATTLNSLSAGWTNLNISDTLTYLSTDGPTFVATTNNDLTSYISVGMKIKLTNSTVKYFIVTAITSTTITFYGGTDYALIDVTIESVYFSVSTSPLGFPINPDKWTEIYQDVAYTSKISPTASTWYNINSASLSVPIGMWKLEYFLTLGCYNASAGTKNLTATLSNSESTNSDNDFTNLTDAYGVDFKIYSGSNKTINLIAKTTYYLLSLTSTSGITELRNWGGGINPPTTIKAVCAYL